ncbi:MAG: RAD55 family ATPase [Thermoplasmata archaeon]|nr:AAA family ATPase [Candidatus Sysuiplasma jiujiangense]MBX8640024.1 RAD55 family ATPase [Candidatus Sysuiplasma jiujiangense]MBX8641436.1 RAD55 family ATPase [Candidatus Sysuiplasma jiujiangense]
MGGDGPETEIARIPTNIEGFDAELEGGIPFGSIVLIAGTPGTMKSTVAFNMMYSNAVSKKVRGVYLTLEQNRISLERQMRRFGMSVESGGDRMRVLDFGIVRKNLKQLTAKRSWLEVFKMYVTNLKDSVSFDFLVIDSLDVLETAASLQNRRDELFYFFEWMRGLDSTVLLTMESPADRIAHMGKDETYLADGIIALSTQDLSDVDVQRRIRCMKMRATNHSMDSFTFLFENGRFMAIRAISKP